MIIYELSIDENNATLLEFPLQEEQDKFLLLTEKKLQITFW